MATDRDVQNARQSGEEAGFERAVQQLRAFTGVTYDNGGDAVTPDLMLAEHLAYPTYRRNLASVERELESEAERMRSVVEQAWQRAEEAQIALDEALNERRSERSGRSAIARATGWIGDQTHPLRAEVKNLEQRWARRRDRQSMVLDDHRRVRAELARVDKWLTAAAEQIDAAEAARAQDIADVQAKAAAARRDSSQRWCAVFTRADFIAGDERRQARAWEPHQVVAGADFGYKWRRDADDIKGEGQWTLHWIPENYETFFEANDDNGTIWLLGAGVRSMEDAMAMFEPLEQRQHERNSVAVVLDAYGKRFGPDDW